MTPLEAFYDGPFWDELRARRTISPSVELAQLWAVELTPAMQRLIDFIAVQPAYSGPELGAFIAFGVSDFLPHTSNALEFMLKQPFPRTALISGTVALGTTGSGDTWLIDVRPLNGSTASFCKITTPAPTSPWPTRSKA